MEISKNGYSFFISRMNIETDKELIQRSWFIVNQLNDMDYVKEELGVSTQGFHLELGARFKPPIIPFSINVNARYNFIQDLVPGEDGFLSLSAGFAFAI